MKRLLLLLPILLLFVACGEKETLVHDDFRSDLFQVLEKLDVAYEENRKLNEDEEELLDRFNDKYILGQFSTEKGMYEMSDIEKQITRDVLFLDIATEHDEPLSSEITVYEQVKGEIKEYLSEKEVPERLVGRYPTYEKQQDIHPQFIEDTEEMVKNLDPVINVRDNIYQDEYDRLKEYVELYSGDGFEVEGTHFLHNEETRGMYMVFWSINYDLDDGIISGYSQERFNELKDELN